jgi:hypothetical protein
MSGERERERQPDSWLVARRYPDARKALVAYEAARDLLLTDDLDASVLRVTVNGTSFVTVLGETALNEPTTERLERALGEATTAELPEDVKRLLRERRRAFKETGFGFMERRSGL